MFYDNYCAMTNIEKYQKRATSIKETLTELKNHVSEDNESKQKEAYNELDSLKKEIDEELVDLKNDSESDKDEIKKLEEIIVNLNSFQRELDDLKNNISSKEENRDAPGFLASIFYWGIIGKWLWSLPLIWDSIKNRADKKLQNSWNQREKTKEKWWFWSKLRWFAKWTAIATWWFRLVKKIFWWLWKKENNEEKDNKNPENNPEDPNQNIESDSEITNSTIITQDPEKNPEVEQQEKIKTDASVENLESPQDGDQEVERLKIEGYSDLFILIRMYELWFIPRTNFEKRRWGSLRSKTKRVFEWWRLDKLWDIRWNFKDRLLQNIKLSKEGITRLRLESINNPDIVKNLDTEINKLTEMEKDINNGKIKKFEDFHKKYWKEIINSEKMFKNKILTWNTLSEAKVEIKKIDQEIKKLQNEAKIKLSELDQKAKNNPKDLKKIQWEAKAMVNGYNKKILELEKQTWIKMSSLRPTELAKLAEQSTTVSKLMKINNGIDKYMERSKLGKFAIWATVIWIVLKWAWWNSSETWKTVWLEAADLWACMVPFAWWVYDIATAIKWESLSGKLSKKDRIVRWVIGWVSVVLDVAGLFTFWAGNAASAALKWIVKWSNKVSKVVKVAKTISEAGKLWMKIGTYWFLWYTAYEMSRPIVVELYKKQVESRLTKDLAV